MSQTTPLPAVLIRKSTGEELIHTVYPRADMEPIVGLDPDLEYLIKFKPYNEPEYDPRIFILVQEDAITTEPHPDYPHLNIYKTTYRTEKRSEEEIEFHLKQAQRVADDAVFRSQEQMTSSIRLLSILDRKAHGVALKPDEVSDLEALRTMRVKIDKNEDNYQTKKVLLQAGIEPEIDAGWEKE